jgi:predicted lysophospholipase L1 biosynthesis ABC-type transport system permease subunit
VQQALGSKTGLVVETTSERQQRHYTLITRGLSRLTQIKLLVLIAAILAVAGALSSMLWQRRDLVAFMRWQGYSVIVLWRWLFCESALLLSIGGLIGATFGLYGQLLGSRFLGSSTGFPVSIDLEVMAAILGVAVMLAVMVTIVALPGYIVASHGLPVASSTHRPRAGVWPADHHA